MGFLECGLVGHELHGLYERGHVAELELYALMPGDGLAEGGALVGVVLGDLHCVLAERGDGGAADAPAVKDGHSYLEADALGAEQSVGGQVDVVKGQRTGARAAHAHLLLVLGYDKPLGLLGEDEGGNALGARIRVGLGEDEVYVRLAGVGYPAFAAVERPAAVRVLGSHGANSRRVGACAGFGEAEGKEVAAGHTGEVLLLLRVRTPIGYHLGRNVADLHRQGKTSAAFGQLVDDNGTGHIVRAHAAVLLRNKHTAEAQLVELGVQLAVKGVVLVHVVVAGLDFLLGEFPDHIADHFLFFVELYQHCHCLSPFP